jgi:prolyl 4-hydroxylase
LCIFSQNSGNVKEALQLTNELLKIVPYHKRATSNKIHYEEVLRKRGVIPQHGTPEE